MVRQLNPNQNVGQAITRGKHPAQARSLYYLLPFSADAEIQAEFPFTGQVNVNGIDNVQSMLVINSDGAAEVTFNFSNNYVVKCPPFSSAILPVLTQESTGLKFTATSVSGVDARVWFLNTRELPAVWVSGYPIQGVLNITGSSVFTSPIRGALSEDSLALAAGNNVALAALGTRNALIIKNPATPTGQGIAIPEPIYIRFGAAASIGGIDSIEILPGETLTAENMGIVSTQSLNIIAATVGHQVNVLWN